MGLDIYCHLVKKTIADRHGLSTKSNRSDIFEALNIEAKKVFKRSTSGMLLHLRLAHQNSSDYPKEYKAFINRLHKNNKWYNEYAHNLMPFGFNAYHNEFTAIKTPDEVEELFAKDLDKMFAVSDAYFRKVNFIYEYFRNDMVNESCIVDKSRIGNLIDLCEDVLSHKGDEDYAREKLPTTSGFFFGSTDYDDWYWHDVKDCIKQMRKLYKAMDEDDFVVWGFSW